MSILVCTPMYGGMCTADYFYSAMSLQEAFLNTNVSFDWLRMTNESLITRARNKCATLFLESDFSHLMFIDADIRFQPDDVARLWNLQVPVAVAPYPMKRQDSPLSAWVGGRLVHDMNALPETVPVDYAGTGFMLIAREVFEALKEKVPEYSEGYEGFEDRKTTWGFFLDPIEGGIHLSEDYYFCKRARELGYDITMDTTIRLGHVGTWTYEALS